MNMATYVIMWGAIRFASSRESTEEVQKREVYILSYMGNVLKKNTDPHVWEDQITLVYQHELLKALNLR